MKNKETFRVIVCRSEAFYLWISSNCQYLDKKEENYNIDTGHRLVNSIDIQAAFNYISIPVQMQIR